MTRPLAFANIARVLLDRCAARAAARGHPGYDYLSGTFDAFAQTDFDRALSNFAKKNASDLLDVLLPWFVAILNASSNSSHSSDWFRYDAFAFTWRDGISQTQTTIVNSLISALTVEATEAPARFSERIKTVAEVPIATAQWVVAVVYANLPARSEEALTFLTSDPRRLVLGERGELTANLVRVSTISASDAIVAQMESNILAFRGSWRPKEVRHLQWIDLEQFHLLRAFASARLSVAGQRRLAELRRKYPGQENAQAVDRRRHLPRGETSPITEEKARRMTDVDWLRALGKHKVQVHPLERSPRQLAEILKKLAAEDVIRFAAFFDRVPDDTSPVYVGALVEGLAEGAKALPDAVRRGIRRFAPTAPLELRRMIAWVLQKHPGDVDIEMRHILDSWIRDPSLDTEHDQKSLDYLNPDRGAAFLALMYALRSEDSDAARARRWTVFEYVASQEVSFLRAAVIEELRYELLEDTPRALAIFDRLLDRGAEVLGGHYVDDFLRLALGRDAARVLPIIEDAIVSHDESIRKRGALLAALAAVSPEALSARSLQVARSMVWGLLHGSSLRGSGRDRMRSAALWLRGSRFGVVRIVARAVFRRLIRGGDSERSVVADILAHNVDGPAADYCIEQLSILLTDETEDVRQRIGRLFSTTPPAALFARRDFLMSYARSTTVADTIHDFSEFLFEHGFIDPSFSLDLIEKAFLQLRSDDFYLAEDLPRFVLRVGASLTVDEHLQSRAMDVFDAMDELFGYSGNLLTEWDRA
jgi:hypothetical protein